MLERDFQPLVKKELEAALPDCVVIKQDPNTSFQGVPDLIVLYGDYWASLEVKKDPKAKRQPNQEHYTEKWNRMGDASYAGFIDPTNYKEVISEIQSTFRSGGSSRNSKRVN